MNLRGWLVAGLLLGAAGWWYSPLSPRVPDAPPVARMQDVAAGGASSAPAVACPPPPRVAIGAPPLQSPVPDGFPALSVGDARLVALAGFSIEARVLSRRDYSFGREADYSPTDLALGWGRMRDDAVVEALSLEQRGRWYFYRWGADGPPIPSREIALSSANMHLVPANASVARALGRVRKDQRVRIDGWLVELHGADGWRWRSSLTRDDQGGGACELVYACSITPL